MIFAIASIPHTGHTFTTELLGDGVRQERAALGNYPQGPCFMYAHVYSDMMPMIRWWAKNWPCIAPMRHPMTTASTYIGRGEKIADLYDNYRRLIALDREFDLLYLPVDTDDRDNRLSRISDRLGRTFRTDWAPKNAGGLRGEVNGNNRAMVRSLMEEFSDFFASFGYDPPA